MTDAIPSSWPRRRLGENAPDEAASAKVVRRVVMIDDHALLAESVVMTLRQSGLDARTVSADTPNLVEIVLALRPDLVLLDLFLTETADTSNAALAAFADAGILVLVVTATHDALLHARCLELGATGVEFRRGIRRGDFSVPLAAMQKILEADGDPGSEHDETRHQHPAHGPLLVHHALGSGSVTTRSRCKRNSTMK